MAIFGCFRGGVGRFAKARGSSHFARAFNGQLPRQFASQASFPVSFARLGELPLCGFAEQDNPITGLVNSMRLSEEISDLESDNEEELKATSLASAEVVEKIISSIREWSGSKILARL
jgi:hypothetical protein